MLHDLKWGINQVEITCDHMQVLLSCRINKHTGKFKTNLYSGPFIQNFLSNNLLACVAAGLLIVGLSFSFWDTKALNFKELRSSAKFCGGSKKKK